MDDTHDRQAPSVIRCPAARASRDDAIEAWEFGVGAAC